MFLYNKKSPICPECGTLMAMDYSKKYQKLFYFCPNTKCNIAISAYHSSSDPVGIPANRNTRALRQRAHKLATKIWNYKDFHQRNKMYAWLGKNTKSKHIGEMKDLELLEVINKFSKIINKFNL
jgi:hypothetical protein